MTTRNFRVNNGLSVGDITISASANTITGLATAAPSADGDVSNKKYVDDQDALIASDTLTFTNKTFDANGTGNSISNIEVADLAAGAVVLESEGIGSNDNDTTLPTSAAVKDFVDTETANVASDTLTLTNKTFDANGTGNSISNIDFADFASGVVADEDTMSSNSATKLATQQSIKAYVDTEIGNISTAAISVGNSSATISDTGSDGALTVVCDGNTELVVNDTNATFSGDVVVTGNLTVSGSATYLDVNNLAIEDNLLIVSKNNSGGSDLDAGLMVERGSAGNNAALYWNEGDDKFKAVLTTSGSDATAITDSSTATIVANIEGAVTGNADTATEATNVTVTANNTANETVYLTFVDGATGTQGIETDTGLSYNPSTNVLSTTASQAQYADVAERFEADAPMEIGSVVEVGGTAEITEATTDLSSDVFGVISDKPAYMMNAGAGDNTTHPFVAMTGRTPVRVVGAVTKGQRLVTSSTKGCARAVAQGESISPFNVIGRALETNTDAGIKLVNCAVRTNN